MKKSFRYIAVIFLFFIIGAIIPYFVVNKPKRNVESEKGIEVTAAQLVKEYQASEPEANKKYLDKAIQVSGTVTEVKNNQDGNLTVALASDDVFTGVFCTLKTKETTPPAGAAVTIKGICSGMLSDVRLREAVIVK